MILLVDVGHSRVKWGSLEGAEFHYGGSCSHGELTFPELARSQWAALRRPVRVVASVTPRGLLSGLVEWVRGHWDIQPEVLSSQASGHGVVNAYIEPRQLGTDRWAALVAARAAQEGPVCIVDCGTALTIDALSAGGEHLGGLIAPGLRVMRRALMEGVQGIAAALDMAVDSRMALLAQDTAGGVAGGTLYAAVALIDRVVADVTAEIGSTPTCLICGGDGATILPLLAAPFRYEPHLVLLGLAAIAAQSRGQTSRGVVRPSVAP
jgi:type III pantothenate kinase